MAQRRFGAAQRQSLTSRSVNRRDAASFEILSKPRIWVGVKDHSNGATDKSLFPVDDRLWHICLDGRLGQKSGGLPTFVDP
jgi:hypothetical protein